MGEELDRIVLIDDDKEVLQINAKYLTNQGFKVAISSNPQKGLEAIQDFKPKCIVLDIMMPQMDGFTLCTEIRKICDVPIIFLSGRTSDDDKIKGFTLGADDYICKPYSLRELEARIKVNISKYKKIENVSVGQISLPPLLIDAVHHKAFYNEEEILLSNREYELLYFLANNRDRTVLFQEIGEKLWGVYHEEDKQSIMVNASRLRKKLEQYVGLDSLIETVWGKGYMLRTVKK